MRTSFWFLPAVLVLAGIVLAFVLAFVLVNSNASPMLRRLLGNELLFAAGTDGSRHMLSAVATSMITIAGVAFSITIVVLSLASNQYTPRILRNFMRDRGNQAVLGVFVGIYVYCLIVLRAIHDSEEESFLPGLAIVVGLLLSVVGVGFFIYFIHHTAQSVQASHVLGLISRQTISVIRELWPSPEEAEADANRIPDRAFRWQELPLDLGGYVMAIDYQALAGIAEEHDTVILLHASPGDFVVAREAIASADSPRNPGKLAKAVAQQIVISSTRTIEQDPALGLRQVVDIALKALSPGVNDVHTAVEAIDHLTSIVAVIVSLEEPRRTHFREGGLRVIGCERSFRDLMADTYSSIRNSAGGNVAVYGRLLRSLRTVAGFTLHPERRLLIANECEAIAEAAERGIALARDKGPLVLEAERLAAGLREGGPPDARGGSHA